MTRKQLIKQLEECGDDKSTIYLDYYDKGLKNRQSTRAFVVIEEPNNCILLTPQ